MSRQLKFAYDTMKFVWAVLIAAAACHVKATRIVGGSPTTIEQYPSIVQVEFLSGTTWYQGCAGNILTRKYVVSAAHCFSSSIPFFFNINTRRIRAGSSTRNSGGIIINASRRLNHPSYRHFFSQRGLDGDITLVELESLLTFGSGVQAVAIPPQGFELPDGLPVVHAGWGAIYNNGPPSSQLLDVAIYTINRELCTERYADLRPNPGVVTENMICVGILDVGGKDACQGDSGGPLYYDSILVGVVSWSEGCANDTYPGVTAKVSSYTEWIVDNAV